MLAPCPSCGLVEWAASPIATRPAPTGDATLGPAMRLLVAEDDRKVASHIRQGLEEEGYAVEVAPDAASGSVTSAEVTSPRYPTADYTDRHNHGSPVCRAERKRPRFDRRT